MAHSLKDALSGLNKPAATKKLGTPHTDMWIEPTPAAKPSVKPKATPAPVIRPKASKDITPLLNAPNTYDRNSYTHDMFPVRPKPVLSKA